MLQAIGLGKDYDGFLALRGLSFEVRKGEVFGLLGPNGAGKSTCMKILVGLIKPTTGQALVDGLDVTKSPLETKARIGYLPELPDLFENVTGREFLQLIGKFRNVDEKLLESRVQRFARLLDLGNQMDSLLGTYSKGMKQKISFASAVIHEPPILILDEPTSGLDPRFGRYIKDLIREAKARGTAVLLSTHITSVAEELCDRVCVIAKGTSVAMGTPAEVMAQTSSASLEESFIKLVGGELWTGSGSMP